ncbi:MAG: hypothetical protein NVS2B3_07290 [Vulcanimicrobiaceae bacterium]
MLALHVVALVVGGGLALAADRTTLHAARPSSDPDQTTGRRGAALLELAAVHRIVGAALGASLITGTALFFLHSERYVTSATFWIKMALVVGLAANALVMQLAERRIREPSDDAAPAAGWRALAATARTSSALWLAVAIAGTILGQLR